MADDGLAVVSHRGHDAMWKKEDGVQKKKPKKAEERHKATGDWRDGGVARMTVELPQGLVDDMSVVANAKGLKLSHIVRLWLLERVAAEKAGAAPQNGTGMLYPGSRS